MRQEHRLAALGFFERPLRRAPSRNVVDQTQKRARRRRAPEPREHEVEPEVLSVRAHIFLDQGRFGAYAGYELVKTLSRVVGHGELAPLELRQRLFVQAENLPEHPVRVQPGALSRVDDLGVAGNGDAEGRLIEHGAQKLLPGRGAGAGKPKPNVGDVQCGKHNGQKNHAKRHGKIRQHARKKPPIPGLRAEVDAKKRDGLPGRRVLDGHEHAHPSAARVRDFRKKDGPIVFKRS
jgi:hypothetical protein